MWSGIADGATAILRLVPDVQPGWSSCRQFASFHPAKAAHRELLQDPHILILATSYGYIASPEEGYSGMSEDSALDTVIRKPEQIAERHARRIDKTQR